MIFTFLFLCACAAWAQETPPAAPQKIPILFSDHHADHALWLLEKAGGQAAALVVVDAHADTAPNPARDNIRAYIQRGNYRAADDAFGNHNWIEPLVPHPVDSLVWISGISGFPGGARYEGFIQSSAGWGIKDRRCITLDELDTVSPGGGVLFVSIDLDFFYQDTCTPRDIPFVFDKLLDFSLRRPGNILWAVCVSRAWLPDSEYAWEVLEQSLAWLSSKTEFAAPALTLFSAGRRDTSRRARYFQSMGLQPPGLHQNADEMPERVRQLLAELTGGREFGAGR
jgi:hypothetical protein